MPKAFCAKSHGSDFTEPPKGSIRAPRPQRAGPLLFSHGSCVTSLDTIYLMMSGDECRARSRLARERAMVATDYEAKTTWTELIHDWLKLGRLADAHAELEAGLLAKEPN